jgi:hypothetical protein
MILKVKTSDSEIKCLYRNSSLGYTWYMVNKDGYDINDNKNAGCCLKK